MILEFTSKSPAIIHLAAVDTELSKLIHRIGDLSFRLDQNYYQKIIMSIVGQQLSIKAKETIWNRFVSLCGKVNPQCILTICDDDLRNAGLSYRKISYIKGFSKQVLTEQIKIENLDALSDSEVVKLLTGIKGIGEWTAEMFLIFSLGRLDVMSFNDAGLRRAINWLYKFEGKLNVDDFEKISKPWSPFRSVASLYLWEAINTGLIDLGFLE